MKWKATSRILPVLSYASITLHDPLVFMSLSCVGAGFFYTLLVGDPFSVQWFYSLIYFICGSVIIRNFKYPANL